MQSKRQSFEPVALTLTLLAALVRLIPHPPNFAPIGAIALFGGAKLKGWQAYCVPLLAMIATDPILSWIAGGYPAYSRMSLVIYGCFLINVLLARNLIRSSSSPTMIGAVALIGSTQFYLITNFFVWLSSGMYPYSGAGLATCYVAALPFFARTVLADLFYCFVLFGVYYLVRRKAETANRVQPAF